MSIAFVERCKLGPYLRQPISSSGRGPPANGPAAVVPECARKLMTGPNAMAVRSLHQEFHRGDRPKACLSGSSASYLRRHPGPFTKYGPKAHSSMFHVSAGLCVQDRCP